MARALFKRSLHCARQRWRSKTVTRICADTIRIYNPAHVAQPSSSAPSTFPLLAQTTQEKVREYRKVHEHQILKEFTTLLSIPNVASDTQNIRRNAALIVEMMKQRGLNPRLLEARHQTRHLPFTASGRHRAHNGPSSFTRITTGSQLIQNSGPERSRGNLSFVQQHWKRTDRS